jgi:DNA-binding LytR/AlgR family response regulator
MKVKDQVDFISSSHDEVQIQNETFSSAHNPQLQPVKSPSYPMPFIFIKNGKQYERVNFGDILFIQAFGSYSKIMTTKRNYTQSISLARVIIQLNCASLLRCHRSYAVNKDIIIAFDDSHIKIEHGQHQHMLPLSISYKSDIVNTLRRLRS